MSAIAQKSVSVSSGRMAVRPSAVRPVSVRRNVTVRASAAKPEALAAAVVTASAAVLSTPLVAEAAITPSLSNFLSSLVAGGFVLLALAGAITLVSNFDPVSRD